MNERRGLGYMVISTALATLTAAIILGGVGFVFTTAWKTANRVTVLEVGQNATNRALASEIVRLERVVGELKVEIVKLRDMGLKHPEAANGGGPEVTVTEPPDRTVPNQPIPNEFDADQAEQRVRGKIKGYSQDQVQMQAPE